MATSGLLVGYETSDDAAALQIDQERTLLATLDFLTPLVDDPFDFGRIAAANALSDIYAMGGKPLVALNILALDCSLGVDCAEAILQGGADAVREAGALLVGGHSIDDPEPKYGLSVIGMLETGHLVKNAGAKPGDLLYLTKPLGVGLLSAAYKIGIIDITTFQPAIDSMKELNDKASVAMIAAHAHAATDVTGFGLAGHLYEMLEASHVGAVLNWRALPLLPQAEELSAEYCRPNRTFSIMDFAERFVLQESLDDTEFDNRMGVICDPQTSGGLLIAIDPSERTTFERTYFDQTERKAACIGAIIEDPLCQIRFSRPCCNH